MQQGEIAFQIDCLPAEVWRHIADIEGSVAWVPDLVSVEKLTPGAVGVGSRFAEVVTMSGKSTQAEVEVTRFEPPFVIAHAGSGGPAKFTASFTLAQAPDAEGGGSGGTLVAHVWTVELSGVMKMMEPMIRGWMEKGAQAAMDSLKRMMEAGELS